MPHTAADLLLERLMEWGVDTVFGLPGDGINGVWESLRRHRDRIRYVHVRHEEVGAMAAVGYAKFTGRLGVRLSTSGPGAIHLANGLLDARLEQAPLLAITRMTYHDLAGTSYLQDFETDYLFSNLALYNQRIMGPAHVHNVVDAACRTALGQRGPSHIASRSTGRRPTPRRRSATCATSPATRPPACSRPHGCPSRAWSNAPPRCSTSMSASRSWAGPAHGTPAPSSRRSPSASPRPSSRPRCARTASPTTRRTPPAALA